MGGSASSPVIVCPDPRCGEIPAGVCSEVSEVPDNERLYFIEDGKLQCNGILQIAGAYLAGVPSVPQFTSAQITLIMDRAFSILEPRILNMRQEAREAQQARIALQKPIVLEGASIISYWRSPLYEIYLFGERHVRTPCPDGALLLSEYLEEEINASPFFIDLFVEQPLAYDEQGKYAPNELSELAATVNTYRGCVQLARGRDRRCLYENVRVHHVDLRFPDPVASQTNPHVYAMLVLEAVWDRLVSMSQSQTWERVTEMMEAVDNSLQVLRVLVDLPTQSSYIEALWNGTPRLLKQFSHLDPHRITQIVNYFRESPLAFNFLQVKANFKHLADLWKKYAQLQTTLSLLQQREAIILRVQLKEALGRFSATAFAPLMDGYTLARLFRSYLPRESYPLSDHPEHATHSIVVTGSAHTIRLNGFFATLVPEFVLVSQVATTSDNAPQCLSLPTNPLF